MIMTPDIPQDNDTTEMPVVVPKTLRDILHLSPYYPGYRAFPQEAFEKDYLIVHNGFSSTKNALDEKLNDIGQFHQAFICFLYGFAGTGKTTFLNWYVKQSTTKDNFNYLFIDLSLKKRADDKQSTFIDDIRNILNLCMSRHEKEIIELFEFIKDNLVNLSGEYFSKENFRKSFNKNIIKDDKLYLTKNTFCEFINIIDDEDILLLYFLFYNQHTEIFFRSTNGFYSEKSDTLLFIDNIDSIKSELHSKKILQKMIQVYMRSYVGILENNLYKGKFDTNKKIHFIFSIRDYIHSILNSHDDAFLHKERIPYILSPNGFNKIVLRRQQIAKKILLKQTLSIDNYFKILKFMSTDRNYFQKHYFPLFNYNIRELVHYVYTGFGKLNYHSQPEKMALTLGSYEHINHQASQLDKSSFRVGSRGILFHFIISHLKENSFISGNLILNEGSPVITGGVGRLNLARIILTIIHNLNRYSFDSVSKRDHPQGANLYAVYEQFDKLFTDYEQDFSETLCSLFLFHDESWSHLVTIEGVHILHPSDHIEILRKLEAYKIAKADIDSTSMLDKRRELESIKLGITPAGYTFLKDIIRHFEFHSVKAGNTLPLFASAKSSLQNNRYPFEEILEKARGYTIKCIDSLSIFLDELDRVNETKKVGDKFDFLASPMVFKMYNAKDMNEDDQKECSEMNTHGFMLINRIIDSHTNYIDNFRHYVLSYGSVIAFYASKKNKPTNIIKNEINKLCLDIIEAYIERYYIKNNPRAEILQRLQKVNLRRARSDFSISINENRQQQNYE